MRTVKLIFFFLLLGVVCPVQGQSWLWGREAVPGNNGFCEPSADHLIATDAVGNVYMGGNFSGSITFGSYTIYSPSQDAYLVKYNSAGQVLWVRQSYTSASDYTDGCGVALDPAGNVYLSGSLIHSVSFGTLSLTRSNYSSFLVKYDSNGNLIWAKASQPLSPNAISLGTGIAVDHFGNIYQTGTMVDTVSFGTFTLFAPVYSMFLVKYDANGNFLWAKNNGSNSRYCQASGVSIAVDGAGNAVVTGNYNDTINFGSTTLAGSQYNAFLVKFDPSGTIFWANRMNGTSSMDYILANSVALDSLGDAYVTGSFSGTVIFGANTLFGGQSDLFLVKYYSGGHDSWAKMDKKPPDYTNWGGLSVVCNGLSHGGGYLTASGGNFNNSQTFIFGLDTFRLNSIFSSASILFSFDSTGAIRCGSIYTEGWEDDGTSVTVDRAGNYIYITGDIANPVRIGNDSLIYGGEQTFIARWMDCSFALLSSLQTLNSCNGPCTGIAKATPSGGLPPYTYSWSPSGGSSDTARALCAGTYTCFVSDARGAIHQDTVTIRQDPSTLTVTGNSGGTLAPGHDTTLAVIVSGGSPAYTYAWNGVPGGNTFTVNPMLTTSYNVTVTDSLGCKVSRTILVNVEPCAALFIPNAFSPNQDGQNDKECIRGLECISNLDFNIYDRWGERVFETTDPNRCWDGTYNGREMESAVYVYYLKGTLLNGQAFEKKGNISLVR